MEKDVIFKKRLFGGFDRRQVIEYIAVQKKKTAKMIAPSEYEAVKKELAELKNKYNDKDEEIASLNQKISELEEKLREQKKTTSAKKTVKIEEESSEKATSQDKMLEETEEKVKALKAEKKRKKANKKGSD